PQLYCRFVYLPCFLDSFREGGGRILPRSDGGAAAPGRTEPSPGAAEPRVQRWNSNNAPPLHISSTGCPRAPERVFRAFPQDIHTEGRRGGRGALSHARTAHGGIRGASATGAANFQRRRAAAFRFSTASQQRTRTNRARPRPADAAGPLSLISAA